MAWQRTAKAIPGAAPESVTDAAARQMAANFLYYDGVLAIAAGRFETPFFWYEDTDRKAALRG